MSQSAKPLLGEILAPTLLELEEELVQSRQVAAAEGASCTTRGRCVTSATAS
jgi:hypothetical protein